MTTTQTTYYFKREVEEVFISQEELARELDQKYQWFMHEAAVQEAEYIACNHAWE